MQNWNSFAELSDNASLWIRGFSDALTTSEMSRVQTRIASFVAGWKTHRRSITCCFEIFQNRFLILAAESSQGVSGCAVDDLFRMLQSLSEVEGLNCLDSELVFFRDQKGSIQAIKHLEFFGLVEGGTVRSDTLVFDTNLKRLAELRAGRFERAYSTSWHNRVYGPPTALSASL